MDYHKWAEGILCMLQRARQSSLVEDAASQIQEAIVGGTFVAGQKLPSSQELEGILGTSRGTLREALRILAQKGLVEIRLGSKGGVFVKESSTKPVAQGLDLLIRQRAISLEDLAEFRKVVEGGLMKLVAKKLRKPDFIQLKQFLEELKRHVSKGAEGWGGFLEVEVRLRKALIRIAGNRMYEAVLVPIHENIFAYAHNLSGEDANVEEAFHDWRQIIEALERKESTKAEAITQDHISRYARRMKKEIGRNAVR
jgi:GntR family transcriptional regulator, transcriptional repressor for pyruvate dehydrogenase complex